MNPPSLALIMNFPAPSRSMLLAPSLYRAAILLVCLCLALGLSLDLQGAVPVRTTRSLDSNWRFHLGAMPDAVAPSFNDSSWRLVDVPHDYVVEGTFAEVNPVPNDALDPNWYWLHGFLPVQPAVYRRTLVIPKEMKGQRLWLEFDGVFSNSSYWLNGCELGSQYSGYTRSRFDISDAVNYGSSNVLVVRVDPRYDGWWYEGGGIYRHVRLVSVNPIAIAPEGVFVTPSVLDLGDGSHANASVSVQTEINNTSTSASSVTAKSEVLDAEGNVLGEAISTYEIGIGSSHTITHKIALPSAVLWGPETPYLYRLRSTVFSGDRLVDELVTSFGVREVRFDADRGVILNGRPLKLQGVNMHQDHAGVGVAVPDRVFTWKLERLKEVGCNAIRTSHNPVAPFLLDECDRLGFLVIAENRHMGDTSIDQTPKDTPAKAHRDLSALVLRDRNHPSIILWSLCNEQWIQGTEEAAAMIKAMKQRVHELDPSRPITAAMNGGFDSAKGMGSVLDVIGINYNPWVYDAVHALFPKAPIVASEIASEIATRGVYKTEHWEDYYGDRERGHIAAYSISAGPAGQTVENAWLPVASRDFIGGGFVWAAFDYKGEPRPFSWPVINCHYGFMDICGFPKDSYYYYQALWTEETVLHLFPHWSWAGSEGQEIPVWVHTNCEEVELFLNDQSLGTKRTTPGKHLEWTVKYTPGKLVAKGLRRGQWKEVSQETTTEAVALRLIADRNALTADAADVAIVKVEALDAKGRTVPGANNKVTFTLTGPARLIGVGNGDPSSHEPDKSNTRSLFHGLAQALVQVTATGGQITLLAEAQGLAPCTITFSSQ